MEYTPIILFACAGWWFLRWRRQKLVRLETRYRFYALRDRLRQLALDGLIDPNSHSFLHLDRNVTYFIKMVDQYNFYSFCVYAFLRPEKQQLTNEMDSLNLEIQANEHLASFKIDYSKTLVNYLKKLNPVVDLFFNIVLSYSNYKNRTVKVEQLPLVPESYLPRLAFPY